MPKQPVDPMTQDIIEAADKGAAFVKKQYSKGAKRVKNALAPFREAAAKIRPPPR